MIIKAPTEYSKEYNDFFVKKYVIECTPDEYLLINKVIGKTSKREPVDEATIKDLAEVDHVFKNSKYVRDNGEETKHAHWSKEMYECVDEFGDRHIGYLCSNCKQVANKMNYCGNCGAIMDEEAE